MQYKIRSNSLKVNFIFSYREPGFIALEKIDDKDQKVIYDYIYSHGRTHKYQQVTWHQRQVLDHHAIYISPQIFTEERFVKTCSIWYRNFLKNQRGHW